MASVLDIVLYSLFSLLGNSAKALTGFGQAIVFFLFWQIAVLFGYHSDFKYAVFIQAFSLFSAHPLYIYKAKIRQYAHRKVLMYFTPSLILSTLLGQYTASMVNVHVIQIVGGFLVLSVAGFEVYQRCVPRKRVVVKDAKYVPGIDDKIKEREDIEQQKAAKVEEERHETEGGDDSIKQEKLHDPESASDSGSKPKSIYVGFSSVFKTCRNVFASPLNKTASHIEQADTCVIDSVKEHKAKEEESLESEDSNSINTQPFAVSTIFYTLLTGLVDGFFGGLVGISGPPLIIYFLHPPHPVKIESKEEHRSTVTVIGFVIILIRVGYYIFGTFAYDQSAYFTMEDLGLYLSTAVW
eukprot:CAMPEP_0194228720 /NCGR_PEP_ID=MMETSP0156-20130528/43516_1 /TAXON_ID=33649 /ORGANISM="Thalassionema nitzschioides, Strain L26-B" /LENGTH=352 /DNA_ID=CAMNT_0038961239 /DNA_START=1489 /DNA_END=2544 /DNA_ORIENTATION=+